MAHYIEEDEDVGIDGDESMLLDEEMDDDYEPSDQEIIEYAQFLGMDLKEDKDLVYIAKEGLKAPLPENFKPYKRRNGEIVYVNLETNEFQEEHPCDEYYRGLYLEAKRKKNQKQTNSKFKKNFPIGGSTATSKVDPFPSSQPISLINKATNKGTNNLDKSLNSDQHDSFISNNQDSSFSGMPVPLMNKEIKKKQGNIGVSETKALNSPFENEGQNAIEEVDQKYDDKFFEYYKEKEKEISTIKKELKEQQEEYEEKLHKSLKNSLKELKSNLNEEESENKSSILLEKEKVKAELQIEYTEKFESEIKKLDKQHFSNKRDLSINQEGKMKEDLRCEEENLDKDFLEKEMILHKQKNDLESELELIRKQEEKIKKKVNSDIDFEKENVIQEYRKRQREFESIQRVHQEESLKNYCLKELQNRLKEEIQVLENAKQQKLTLQQSQKEEMKESFERRYILEKEKLDLQMNEELKQFEEKEKIRKDQEILKIYNLELKQAKENKKTKINNEIIQLEENFQKRLKNYQEVLQEKCKKEIDSIEEETEKSIMDMKKQVDNIKLDINNKNEILKELQILQSNEDMLDSKVKDIEQKIFERKNENEILQQRLKIKQREYFEIRDYSVQTIDKLKVEINEKNFQIEELFKEKTRNQIFPSAEKNPKRSHSAIKENKNLSLIMKELQEIKSFILPKEEETHNSYLKVFKNDFNLKTESKSLMSSIFNEKNNLNQKSKLLSDKLIEDWVSLYQNELSRIETAKQEIRKDKLKLKKVQEKLIKEQERFKESFREFKTSRNQTGEKKHILREQKRVLNDDVKKLNDDVYRLRENEEVLKEKENYLVIFGDTIKKSREKSSNSGIEIAYKHYLDIKFDYKPPLIKPIQSLDPIFKVQEESQAIYKNWENLVENQEFLNISESGENHPMRENNIRQLNHLEFEKNYKKYEAGQFSEYKSNQVQSTNYIPYDYKNRIKILDLKLRSVLNGPENEYTKKQVYQSTESKYKINELFTQQSQFLKDMKLQLNSQLYEKTSAHPTSVVFSRYL